MHTLPMSSQRLVVWDEVRGSVGGVSEVGDVGVGIKGTDDGGGVVLRIFRGEASVGSSFIGCRSGWGCFCSSVGCVCRPSQAAQVHSGTMPTLAQYWR